MKVAQGSGLTAVLDACVLAPMPLCDTLLRCAESPAIFRAFWSCETLREVSATLEKFGYSRSQAERRVHAMQEAFPEAVINFPREVLGVVRSLPDPGDAHVVVAAIEASAQVIVTFNLKH
jgi:predicted nucleic acid-binding protein